MKLNSNLKAKYHKKLGNYLQELIKKFLKPKSKTQYYGETMKSQLYCGTNELLLLIFKTKI